MNNAIQTDFKYFFNSLFIMLTRFFLCNSLFPRFFGQMEASFKKGEEACILESRQGSQKFRTRKDHATNISGNGSMILKRLLAALKEKLRSNQIARPVSVRLL